MRRIVPALALLAACARTAPVPGAATVADITTADLEHRLSIIAHDSMMGRETGSEGDYKTAEYIASEFKRLGLAPAGDDGTYFQTVPFWRIAIDRRSRIIVQPSDTLQVRRDFLPAFDGVPLRTIDRAQTVFLGTLDDTAQWPAPSELQGRVALIDVPAGRPMRGLRLPPARLAGAAAVAVAMLEQMSAEQIARLIEGRPGRDTTYNPAAAPVLFVSHSALSRMRSHQVTVSAGYTHDPVAHAARNVVAILPGSDPALRGEYVALTAHNDHVGFDHFPVDHDSIRAFDRVIRPMGADSPPREPSAAEWQRIRTILDSLRRVHTPRLDSIRNGADDDGTGTASILEIAEKMVRGSAHPRRSILFVSHVAEEAGLLGSAYYTDHATVPVDSIVAEIDQDMVGRGLPSDVPHPNGDHATPTYLEVVGDQKLSMEFSRALDAANARQPQPFEFDRSYAAPGHPLQYYCRADHYNYARYGIPAVAISRGEHLDYHQVTDEYQYIDYPDFARVAKMVYDAALSIANADQRPKLDVAKPANPHAPCRQ
jgi:hypothetical protein